MRILVPDDVSDVADVLASMVRTAGATVFAASDPAEALDLVADETEDWSVLVTDLEMPGHSGVDLARAAARRDPPLPVVLVTALPERVGRNRDLFAGILAKPVDATRLIALICAATAT